MQPDLNHIQRQIQNDQVNIDEAKRQAETQRLLADQMTGEGNDMRAAYYEQEALRFDKKVSELQDELAQLQTDKERTENRIAELEQKKSQLDSEHESQIIQITDELNRLKGSSLTL